ncbi:MAG: hypothetical protein V8R49_03930 [Duodenibacillus massiliensis]
MVTPVYLDKNGRELAPGADVSASAFSRYVIPIKKGIRYAPHPAFAKDAAGNYRYHRLTDAVAENSPTPWTFRKKGRGN